MGEGVQETACNAVRQFLTGELCEVQGAQVCVRIRSEECRLGLENGSGQERLAGAEGHACVSSLSSRETLVFSIFL